MLAFADVMHLLADELARLGRGCLAGALVGACALNGFLLGHTSPPGVGSRNMNADSTNGAIASRVCREDRVRANWRSSSYAAWPMSLSSVIGKSRTLTPVA